MGIFATEPQAGIPIALFVSNNPRAISASVRDSTDGSAANAGWRNAFSHEDLSNVDALFTYMVV
jgi:hypothetical protein